MRRLYLSAAVAAVSLTASFDALAHVTLETQQAVAGSTYKAVLRVGHAYEQATAWRARRPELKPGTVQPALDTNSNAPDASNVDAKSRALILDMATRVGLKLDEYRQAILLETAPYALAMAERVRRDRDRFSEPAFVFRFPN